MNKPLIYVVGSLRNPEVPKLSAALREANYAVFDNWYAAGPEADDFWMQYEQGRKRTFTEALAGSFAKHIFDYDYEYLNKADIGVLLLPAGRSGHLELGFLVGRGKRTYILLDGEPERFDVMYRLVDGVFTDQDSLIAGIKHDD